MVLIANNLVSKILTPEADLKSEDFKPTVRQEYLTAQSAKLYERALSLFDRRTPVAEIANQLDLNQRQTREIILSARRERVLNFDFEHMYNREFKHKKAEITILGADWQQYEGTIRGRTAPSGLPPYLASLYQFPLLTKEQEQILFRRMNYQKYVASQILKEKGDSPLSSKELDTLEGKMSDIISVQNTIITRNLRLAVSIAKKFNYSNEDIFVAVSDANTHLFRALRKFDYARDFKFSTYATWAIRKNLIRDQGAHYKALTVLKQVDEEVLAKTPQGSPHTATTPELVSNLRKVIFDVLEKMDSREREIIISRYGLAEGSQPKTLQEVGTDLSVTKERVRQIESRAIKNFATALARYPEGKEIVSQLNLPADAFEQYEPNDAKHKRQPVNAAQLRYKLDDTYRAVIDLTRDEKTFTLKDLQDVLIKTERGRMQLVYDLNQRVDSLVFTGVLKASKNNQGAEIFKLSDNERKLFDGTLANESRFATHKRPA